jgi:hypothetical protein
MSGVDHRQSGNLFQRVRPIVTILAEACGHERCPYKKEGCDACQEHNHDADQVFRILEAIHSLGWKEHFRCQDFWAICCAIASFLGRTAQGEIGGMRGFAQTAGMQERIRPIPLPAEFYGGGAHGYTDYGSAGAAA